MRHLDLSLGEYQAHMDRAVEKMVNAKIPTRIWNLDHTVWKQAPDEIANRLGWLRSADLMQDSQSLLENLTRELRNEGYRHACLLGMGGSSLAPQVFRKAFGVLEGYLDLSILDSTDPRAIRSLMERLDLRKTLFIVSSKSGSTVETLSFFKFFYNQVAAAVGEQQAGDHFLAITDAGSQLEELAERYHFRAVYLNPSNIGGRYSALSYFGLLPAALMGVDLDRLLHSALRASTACQARVPAGENPAVLLGAALGELAKLGRDKLTFFISPQIASFGDWVEQLIAESTGKEGKGILPVVGEQPGSVDDYTQDRVFVHLHLDGDDTYHDLLQALQEAGHPSITINLHDIDDLGWQFFLWEFATAVAGHLLRINPFDQPNVEAAKALAREAVEAYLDKGVLPDEKPFLQEKGITIFTYPELGRDSMTAKKAFLEFLGKASEGDYISLQAFLPPTEEMDGYLNALRIRIRDGYRLATTVGYGPRYLHSTGQLHKGDSGKGLFIQIAAGISGDLPIPDRAGSEASAMTFGILEAAQGFGDWQALRAAHRRILRFQLAGDIGEGFQQLNEWLQPNTKSP